MLLLLHGLSKAMPSPVRWLYCLTLKGLREIQIFKKYSRIIFWFHQSPKFSHSIKHCTVISKGLPILCLILLKTLVCEQKVRPPHTHIQINLSGTTFSVQLTLICLVYSFIPLFSHFPGTFWVPGSVLRTMNTVWSLIPESSLNVESMNVWVN